MADQFVRALAGFGHDDEHPDEDTVPICEAFRLMEQIVDTGSWPTDARWVVDRTGHEERVPAASDLTDARDADR